MSIRSTDQGLRDAFVGMADGAVGSDACPQAERIFDAASGALGPGETADIIDHITTCGACAESWRVAAALAPAPGRASWRRRALWYLGGALAVAAAVVLYARRAPPTRAGPVP